MSSASIAETPDPQSAALAQALARAHVGDTRAYDELVALYRSAKAAGSRAVAWCAAAAVLLTGQQIARFGSVDECLDELAALRDGAAGLAPQEELLVLSGMLLALQLCRPADAFIDACAQRLRALVGQGLDVNLTLAAARALIYYYEPRAMREAALGLYVLASARAGESGATPYRVAHWLNLWRRCAHYAQQPRMAEQALAQMRELAQSHGLRDIEFLLVLGTTDTAIARGDVAAVQAAVAAAEALADPALLLHTMLLDLWKSRLARLRRQTDAALQHACRAHRMAVELQLPSAMLAVYVVNEAQARLLSEHFDAARTLLEQALPLVPEGYAREVGDMIEGVDAFVAVRDGQPDADSRVAALWRGLRERRIYDLFEGFPGFAARLCAIALARDIEADFVRNLIAQRELVAPLDAPDAWPWPLRIHALGGFAVWRDGVLLATEGKAQRKPLALLHALIAHGALSEGEGVDADLLIDELWPDVEAADPKSSFEKALSRLRKWLAVDGALKLADGRLALDARRVWCDVAEFDRVCAALDAALRPHADASDLPRRLDQLITLYRGKLFGGATLEPSSVRARERLALRFTRIVVEAGLHLETRQRWAEAVRLYETALLQDMLAEPVHRALMRCQLALGSHAEARRAFERCRSVLAAELHSTPSAQTLELAQRID